MGTVSLIAGGVSTVVLLAALTLGYNHYTGLIDDKVELAAQVEELTLALGMEKLVVVQLRLALDDWEVARTRLEAALVEQTKITTNANEEMRRLENIFARHDLEKLARAKPGLIERRLNIGTARILRMLECASGADRCDTPTVPEGAPDAAP